MDFVKRIYYWYHYHSVLGSIFLATSGKSWVCVCVMFLMTTYTHTHVCFRTKEGDLKRIRMSLPQMAILLLLTKEIRENLPFFFPRPGCGSREDGAGQHQQIPVLSQCRWDLLPHGSRWGKQKRGMSCKDLLGSNSRFIHADRIQRPLSQEWHPSEQVGDLHGILLLAPSIAETEIRFLGTNPNDSSLLLRSHWEGRRDLEIFFLKNPFLHHLWFLRKMPQISSFTALQFVSEK